MVHNQRKLGSNLPSYGCRMTFIRVTLHHITIHHTTTSHNNTSHNNASDERWWWREVMGDGEGWWRREVVTKGSGGKAKWWRREVETWEVDHKRVDLWYERIEESWPLNENHVFLFFGNQSKLSNCFLEKLACFLVLWIHQSSLQIPWQAWHFARCAENWRKPPTKHRFWGCKFSGSKENS